MVWRLVEIMRVQRPWWWRRRKRKRKRDRGPDGGSKGQMSGDGQGGIWEKLPCSCVVLSLYWYSRFTLMGDWLLWHNYDCGLQWTIRRERVVFGRVEYWADVTGVWPTTNSIAENRGVCLCVWKGEEEKVRETVCVLGVTGHGGSFKILSLADLPFTLLGMIGEEGEEEEEEEEDGDSSGHQHSLLY